MKIIFKIIADKKISVKFYHKKNVVENKKKKIGGMWTEIERVGRLRYIQPTIYPKEFQSKEFRFFAYKREKEKKNRNWNEGGDEVKIINKDSFKLYVEVKNHCRKNIDGIKEQRRQHKAY